MPEKMPLAKGAHGALPNGPDRTTHTAPWGARGTSKRGRGQDGGPPSVCWVCTEQGEVPDRSSVDRHSAALGPRTAPPRAQGEVQHAADSSRTASARPAPPGGSTGQSHLSATSPGARTARARQSLAPEPVG